VTLSLAVNSDTD